MREGKVDRWVTERGREMKREREGYGIIETWGEREWKRLEGTLGEQDVGDRESKMVKMHGKKDDRNRGKSEMG
jgi:hypothetical protein